MSDDIAIRNVIIVDGTGAESFEGEIAIADDRISAVGPTGSVGAADLDIDGKGRVLAPGFVDAHTHDDGALINHPAMEFKIAQGCTTVIVGNCGFSATPTTPTYPDPSGILGADATWIDSRDYMAAVTKARPAVNAMTLTGHNTIRHLVMGMEQRAPTKAELDLMRGHVAAAMAAGACGLSTGLVYEPGRYSDTEEVIALATVAAVADGLYVTHLRSESDGLLEALEEAISVGDAAACPVQISHHKAAGPRNWGRVADSLARVDAANTAGADIMLDAYPYTAASGPMAQYFDLQDLDQELAAVVRFATCPPFRHYEGRMATDIAQEQAVHPHEVIREVLTAPGGEGTICIQFVIDEADVVANYRHPRVMVGSDGVVDLDGMPHPRLFGTFPRVLGRYAREAGVLSLVEAVRRMTSLPADRFGIRDRGRVVEGAYADLVLFDPDTVVDTATYDQPMRRPSGIDAVFVNGSVVVERGSPTGNRPGRFLRYRMS